MVAHVDRGGTTLAPTAWRLVARVTVSSLRGFLKSEYFHAPYKVIVNGPAVPASNGCYEGDLADVSGRKSALYLY
jgi:hypothetical protein